MDEKTSSTYPTLLNIRWQLNEFVFLDYHKEDGVFMDMGPFSEDPSEERTDKAFEFLTNSRFPWLTLNDIEWSIDLDKLSQSGLPQLNLQGLSGQLKHEPAFEVINMGDQARPIYFLRISFWFSMQAAESEPKAASSPSHMAADESSQQTSEVTEISAADQNKSSTPPERNYTAYFFTTLTPEACRQKLQPYVLKRALSSIVEVAQTPMEYTATLDSDTFSMERTTTGPKRFVAYYSGILRPDNEGTMIVGHYGARGRNSSLVFLPYIGILLGICSGLLGLRWIQSTEGFSASTLFSGGCLLLLAVVAILRSISRLQANSTERQEVLDQDGRSVVEFVQKTLQAEPVEQG